MLYVTSGIVIPNREELPLAPIRVVLGLTNTCNAFVRGQRTGAGRFCRKTMRSRDMLVEHILVLQPDQPDSYLITLSQGLILNGWNVELG